mgnify:CR=1 FL=1
MVIFLLIWLALMFPILYDVDKHLKRVDKPERNEFWFNVFVFVRAFLAVPNYYLSLIFKKDKK